MLSRAAADPAARLRRFDHERFAELHARDTRALARRFGVKLPEPRHDRRDKR
jgi:hypothetical protein